MILIDVKTCNGKDVIGRNDVIRWNNEYKEKIQATGFVIVAVDHTGTKTYSDIIYQQGGEMEESVIGTASNFNNYDCFLIYMAFWRGCYRA